MSRHSIAVLCMVLLAGTLVLAPRPAGAQNGAFAGWEDIEEYDYQRTGTVIHIMPDGLSGHSYSTITETVSRDGERMISKFREYARYALEDGKPVITQISGHTLVGDTTPEP